MIIITVYRHEGGRYLKKNSLDRFTQKLSLLQVYNGLIYSFIRLTVSQGYLLRWGEEY